MSEYQSINPISKLEAKAKLEVLEGEELEKRLSRNLYLSIPVLVCALDTPGSFC